jgi:hypothetical protein
MPQAVQIETQAEQQGLPHLYGQAAAGSASRELAFDGRKHTLDQSAAAAEPRRKSPPHFGAHAVVRKCSCQHTCELRIADTGNRTVDD